jgi:hypothetical protein
MGKGLQATTFMALGGAPKRSRGGKLPYFGDEKQPNSSESPNLNNAHFGKSWNCSTWNNFHFGPNSRNVPRGTIRPLRAFQGLPSGQRLS